MTLLFFSPHCPEILPAIFLPCCVQTRNKIKRTPMHASSLPGFPSWFSPRLHFRLSPPRCTSSSLSLPPLFRLIHRLSKAYLFFPLFFCLCSVPSAFASIPEETEGRLGGRRRKLLPRHCPQCCSIRLCKPEGWPQPAHAPPPKLRGLLRAITIKFEVPTPPVSIRVQYTHMCGRKEAYVPLLRQPLRPP